MEKLKAIWAEIRDNLWFLPTIFTLGGGLVAIAAVRLNDALLEVTGIEPEDLWWLFGGGSDAARSILEVIASSIITVTGVVFSVTIIALQLTSTQFTPRVLRTFTADRGNQLVLGVFIGTFTYTLLVQRAVRASDDDGGGFVPAVAITIAIISAIVSIGFLIYFIAHTARSIQANMIIENVTADTRRVFLRMTARDDAAADGHGGSRSSAPRRRASSEGDGTDGPRQAGAVGEPKPVGTEDSGYIQSIDEATLLEAADEHELLLRIEKGIGDFVLPHQPLLLAWPAARIDERLTSQLRRSFYLGPERTPHQDVQLGLIELVDIAIKALSPSINDPTTAITVVDRLAELLVLIAARPEPQCERQNADGRVCLVVSRPTFADALALTFDQVRHHAADNPTVMVKLINRLGEIGALGRAQYRERVLQSIDTSLRHAERAIHEPADRDAVARAALRARQRIADAAGTAEREPGSG